MARFQVLSVHGGMTFRSREDYLDYLRNKDVRLDDKVRWHGNFLKNELGGGFSDY